MGKIIDLTGQKFGMLKVLEFAGMKDNRWAIWRCQCYCGNIVNVSSNDLRSGHTKSCGCFHRNQGRAKCRIWRCWNNMKARCYNPNNKSYKYYGGKGVKICEEWKNDFWKFWDWSVDNGYADNLTIDRIDSDGDYKPENCRWVTMYEQNLNKGNTAYINYEGINVSLMRMSQVLELDYYKIYDYLRSIKKGAEKAI